MNCVEPPVRKLLRKVDNTFVAKLKKQLKDDPTAPGVPPLALLCVDKQGPHEFKSLYKDVYKYEVLGGLHSVTARKEIISDDPANSHFKTAKAVIYCGLTDEEALRVASRHNTAGHFHHEVTHQDYIESCRTRLYEMKSRSTVEPTPLPTKEWKQACRDYIFPEGMKKTQRENILNQASFNLPVWDLAVQVMAKHSSNSLKGSKAGDEKEIKQYHLAPLHHLPESFQIQCLTKILSLELCLVDLKMICTRFRKMETLKDLFTKLSVCSDWKEAVEKYPNHALEARLATFRELIFKGGIPPVFREFCAGAVESVDPTNLLTITKNSATVNFVQADYLGITGQRLTEVTQGGFNLLFAALPDDTTSANIQALAYNARQINSLHSNIKSYNILLLLPSPELAFGFKATLGSCFDSVELAYGVNMEAKSSLQSNLTKEHTLTKAARGILLGHWSEDGSLSARHIRGEHTDVFHYHKEEELYTKLIHALTFEGDQLLNMLGDSTSGSFATTCLGAKRSCTVLYNTEEAGAIATATVDIFNNPTEE